MMHLLVIRCKYEYLQNALNEIPASSYVWGVHARCVWGGSGSQLLRISLTAQNKMQNEAATGSVR